MAKSFYDFEDKELQQGAIVGFSRSYLLGYRKHCKDCEKMDEEETKTTLQKAKAFRYVVLSQSCDIKNKNGFRKLTKIYTLRLYKINDECLGAVKKNGELIATDLAHHLKKIKNTDKKAFLQNLLSDLELRKALDQINSVLSKKQILEFSERIKYYENEKELFELIKNKKNNSRYEDCFFFPKEGLLGIADDCVVRFATPKMIAPNDLQVFGKLNHPFSEALAQRFGSYFFRVALPD
jgi:hypothetical protein